MAQSVLIIADSGTGKSTSIRNLDPKETFIINIANKPLPFKGWKGNYKNISKDNPKGNMVFYNLQCSMVFHAIIYAQVKIRP